MTIVSWDESFIYPLLSIKDHEANIKIKELRAMGQQIQSILPIPDVYKNKSQRKTLQSQL